MFVHRNSGRNASLFYKAYTQCFSSSILGIYPVRMLRFFCLLQVTMVWSNMLQFYIEPRQRELPSYVKQLVVGDIKRIRQGMMLRSSVTMVYDQGHYIVIDSPSATDLVAKEDMLRGISNSKITPGEIQFVVTTHGHPDHFGQGNFFPNARHFFGSYEYFDNNFVTSELHKDDIMQLTRNVQLWNTPGHTAQDVSVIIEGVPDAGTVAIVGDLFYNEEDALDTESIWFQEAWNPIIGKESRRKILCKADIIVPGHGKMFRVSNKMRSIVQCYGNTIFNTIETKRETKLPFEVKINIKNASETNQIVESTSPKFSYQVVNLLSEETNEIATQENPPLTQIWKPTEKISKDDVKFSQIMTNAARHYSSKQNQR